jgi:hypothetical protein
VKLRLTQPQVELEAWAELGNMEDDLKKWKTTSKNKKWKTTSKKP